MTIKLFIIRPFQERHDSSFDLLYGIFTARGENGLTNGIEISPKGILALLLTLFFISPLRLALLDCKPLIILLLLLLPFDSPNPFLCNRRRYLLLGFHHPPHLENQCDRVLTSFPDRTGAKCLKFSIFRNPYIRKIARRPIDNTGQKVIRRRKFLHLLDIPEAPLDHARIRPPAEPLRRDAQVHACNILKDPPHFTNQPRASIFHVSALSAAMSAPSIFMAQKHFLPRSLSEAPKR